MFIIQCLSLSLSLQKQCSAYDYKEILYPLLGLIFNLSTITSPAIQVRHVGGDGCLSLLNGKWSTSVMPFYPW